MFYVGKLGFFGQFNELDIFRQLSEKNGEYSFIEEFDFRRGIINFHINYVRVFAINWKISHCGYASKLVNPTWRVYVSKGYIDLRESPKIHPGGLQKSPQSKQRIFNSKKFSNNTFWDWEVVGWGIKRLRKIK